MLTEYMLKHKKLICIVMILCIIIFNVYCFQQQAKAVAIVDDLLLALAVAILLASGLTFASTTSAELAANDFIADNRSTLEPIIINAETMYEPFKGVFQKVCNIGSDAWETFKEWTNSHYSIGSNIIANQNYLETSSSDYNISVNIGDTIYFIAENINDNYSGKIELSSYNGNLRILQYLYSNRFMNGSPNINTIDTSINVNYPIFMRYNVKANNVTSYLFKEFVNNESYSCSLGAIRFKFFIKEYYDTGVIGDSDILSNPDYTWQNQYTGDMHIPLDLFPDPYADPEDEVERRGGIPYVPDLGWLGRVSDMDWTDIVNNRVGTVPATDTQDVPNEGVIDSEIIDEVTAGDETQTSLKALFFSKFPFCLPWDIANAVSLIAAPAEAPHFEIDLFQNMDIPFVGDTTITFDMSEYPVVGQVSRWTTTIGFCIMLMLITRRLINS